MVIGSPGESGSLMATMTVVSVGPYPLCSLRPLPQLETNSGVHTSPPTTTHSSAVTPAGSTVASAAGVMKA